MTSRWKELGDWIKFLETINVEYVKVSDIKDQYQSIERRMSDVPSGVRKVNGEDICTKCNKPFNEHVQHRDFYWLIIDCDGGLLDML